MTRHLKKKNLTKIFIATTMVLAITLTIANYFLSNKTTDVIIAKVNNQKIFAFEIEQKLRSVLDSQFLSKEKQNIAIPKISSLPKEVVEILAKEVYLERALVKKAQESSLINKKQLKKQIKQAKDNILRQAYIDSIIKKEVNDKAINNKYIELSNALEGKKEFLLFHIVTQDKATIKKAQKQLKKYPRNFAKIAKKYSIDSESAAKGGEIGYILQDNIMPEIAKILPKLTKNQVSQPIHTKFGWHLIKFSKVRDAEALPFETVKNNIYQQLYQETINNINSKITKDAKVKILIPLSKASKITKAEPGLEQEQKLKDAKK